MHAAASPWPKFPEENACTAQGRAPR
jgi:hypothetical protein